MSFYRLCIFLKFPSRFTLGVKKSTWRSRCSLESKRERSKRAVACGLELQSVFLFTPHYLLTVHPMNERQYKAVGGDSGISTQASSLETFELLARMAA